VIDMDDLAQLSLYDRQGLQERAARTEARLAGALAAAAAFPLPQHPGGGMLLLDLPGSLAGVAHLLEELSQTWTTPPVLRWQPILAQLPVPQVILTTRPQALAFRRAGRAQMVDLSAEIREESHPGAVFLFLLGLLARWGAPLDLQALRAELEGLLPEMATFLPGRAQAENPAKQLALAIHERTPLFWAWTPLAGVARDWSLRLILYAEASAAWASGQELTNVQVMARFPRYWPHISTFVQLPGPGSPGPEREKRRKRTEAFHLLLRKRRAESVPVPGPEDVSPLVAAWRLLELGEWVALYSASLYGVDPADRVPLAFLEAMME